MRRLLILLIAIVVSASVQPAQAQIYSLNESLPEFCFISDDQIVIDCLPVMDEDIALPDSIEEHELSLPCSQSANPGGASCSCEVLRIFYRDIVIEKERAAANYQVNAPLLSYYRKKYYEGWDHVSHYGRLLRAYRFSEAQKARAQSLLNNAQYYLRGLYGLLDVDSEFSLSAPSRGPLTEAETKLAQANLLLARAPCPVHKVLDLLMLAMRGITLFIRELYNYYLALSRINSDLMRVAEIINQIPGVLRAR